MSYEVLKNRITNGTAFILQTALDRINALADALEITQEQADILRSKVGMYAKLAGKRS